MINKNSSLENKDSFQLTKDLKGNSNHCKFKIQTLFKRTGKNNSGKRIVKKIIRSTENCHSNILQFSNCEWNDDVLLSAKLTAIENRICTLLGPFFKNFKKEFECLNSDPKRIPQAIILCNSPPTNLRIYALSHEENKIMQRVQFWYQSIISESMHIFQYEYECQKFKILKHSLLETLKEKYGPKQSSSSSLAISNPNLENENAICMKRQKVNEFEPEFQIENEKSSVKNNISDTTRVDTEIPISCFSKIDDSNNASSLQQDNQESDSKSLQWTNTKEEQKLKLKDNWNSKTVNFSSNFSSKKKTKNKRKCIQNNLKITQDFTISNYVTKVTDILSCDQSGRMIILIVFFSLIVIPESESHIITTEAFSRLLTLDKFIAKSIIDGYISLLYKIYSSDDFKFLIFYEGSVVDKIKKKLLHKINAHRRYSIPEDIMYHFILFRDTEQQSQYGIIKIDFRENIILYDGPIHNNPSPIQNSNDDSSKENIYSYAIYNSLETCDNLSQNNPFDQSQCESELIRQIVYDHILEYQSSCELSLLDNISKCFKFQNTSTKSSKKNFEHLGSDCDSLSSCKNSGYTVFLK